MKAVAARRPALRQAWRRALRIARSASFLVDPVIEAIAQREVPLVVIHDVAALDGIAALEEVTRTQIRILRHVQELRAVVAGERGNERLLARLHLPAQVLAEVARQGQRLVVAL